MQFPPEDKKVNFIEGIITMGGAGGPALKVSGLFVLKNFRTVYQSWCILAMPIWIKQLSIRQMEIC